MKENEKMIYDQFCEVIRKNKTYPEVNTFKSKAKKTKMMIDKLTLEENNKNED